MDNVLLVTIDSLRADRLGFHGYERDTTPRIDEMASNACVYSAAQAHGPTTFSSFPSILTEKHALENPEYPSLSGRTLAETFSEAGFRTLSVTSNAWVSPTYAYDRGFETVHALGRGPRSATGVWDRSRHRISDWVGDGIVYGLLKRSYERVRDVSSGNTSEEERIHDIAVDHITREEPTFTWVHYMTTHTPYEPDPDRDPVFLDELPPQEERRDLVERARRDPASLDGPDRELLSDLYDEAVRHVDRRVGTLLDAITLDDTAVVVTADHGEELWDHGGFEHPPQLHQELLHVPLLIHAPSVEPRVVDDPVGLDAIGSTLLDLAVPSANEGEPLAPLGEPYGPVASACAHPSRFDSATADPNYLRLAVRRGQYKYIKDPDRTEHLYDLSNDANEENDVSDRLPDIANDLAGAASSFEASFEFGEGTEIPDALQDRLADLGYLE